MADLSLNYDEEIRKLEMKLERSKEQNDVIGHTIKEKIEE
jgi:hypothetical protein